MTSASRWWLRRNRRGRSTDDSIVWIPVLSRHEVADLNSRVSGGAVGPGHLYYDQARRVWNYAIDHHPAAVAGCRTETDVAEAIAFAREHGLKLAVRAGGHSIAGDSIVNNGIVVDLRLMNRVTVDPDAGRVRVGAGCRLADMDAATQTFGLATPSGILSEIGVAGLTLGGGRGWLSRKYGLTCDNLISARVVLANGSVVTASAKENTDLYWGLRGAGTDFGVVTELEFATHLVGKTVQCGIAAYCMEEAGAAIEHHQRVMRNAPDDLKAVIYLRRAAGDAYVPEDLFDAPVCWILSVWTGAPRDAMPAHEELWNGARKFFGMVSTVPYLALQSQADNVLGPGACNDIKGGYLSDINEHCIMTLIKSAKRLPNDVSAVQLDYQHGAPGRLHEDDTALADRHADYALNVLGRWQSSAESQPYVEWVQETFAGTQQWQSSTSHSSLVAVDDSQRGRDDYRRGKYERLTAIKTKYDPMNAFSSSQDIRTPDRRGT